MKKSSLDSSQSVVLVPVPAYTRNRFWDVYVSTSALSDLSGIQFQIAPWPSSADISEMGHKFSW